MNKTVGNSPQIDPRINPRPRRARFIVYAIFVLLVALCAGGIYLLIIKLRSQPPVPPPIQPKAVMTTESEATPAQETAAVVSDAKDALAFWERMALALHKGDVAAVWQHSIHPDDADLSDRALAQLNEDAASVAAGALKLTVLDARVSGDWAMLALLRKSPQVQIVEQVLLHEDNKWRMVPQEAFNNQTIMQRIDSPYDALASWYQSNLASWEDKHLPDPAEDMDSMLSMLSAATAAAIGKVEKPGEVAIDQSEQAKPKLVDSALARKAWVAGLKAANSGDYEHANKLIDVSKLAVDEGKSSTAQDLIDYWNELTQDRSFREETIKARRTKTIEDKVNIMLRARLKDGNSWTVKVDLQQIDGRWVLIKEY